MTLETLRNLGEVDDTDKAKLLYREFRIYARLFIIADAKQRITGDEWHKAHADELKRLRDGFKAAYEAALAETVTGD
jgi:hypothetical protein